ncbi:DegT/DnrJ/EryC1/StrS aminotransferase family protein [Candidatus Woesearchaeota archaeon]|nr:DegT/DnrJ/EryC1/StrS aminotransferase family protein [Candidatus Woesearchaeota archaeon]
MEKARYSLNEPYLKGKEKEYVLDVLDSGWLSVKGKHTKIFEEKFAQMVGLKYALALQSGTAALHTTLLSLGIGKNDKVVVPNFTCAGCVTSVIQCGATPVILDVENESFGLNINNVNEFLKKEKPKAIMLVHIYGFPARDTKEIAELCKKENIFLIEDCCEAHGAELGDQRVGKFGDIAVFSVRSEKMIGVGEGGLILTDNKELIDKAFYWATRASPHRGNEHPYWKMYSYSGIGMNYLMPHLLGAVGRAQIENFDEILLRKRMVGEKYQSVFKNIDGQRVQKKIDGSNPSYWLNMVLLEDKSKDEVRKIGEKLIEKGLVIRPPFWPLGNQDVFKKFAFGSQKVGNLLFEKGIILPSSVFLADDGCKGVEEIAEILFDVLKMF